jgi:hypothetical protein
VGVHAVRILAVCRGVRAIELTGLPATLPIHGAAHLGLRMQALPGTVPNALVLLAVRSAAPEHDTFHEVTARRIRCIGSGCLGQVLGPLCERDRLDDHGRDDIRSRVIGAVGEAGALELLDVENAMRFPASPPSRTHAFAGSKAGSTPQ